MDYYEKTGQEGDFHPVHRLDRGTSGLLAAATHPHAQSRAISSGSGTENCSRSFVIGWRKDRYPEWSAGRPISSLSSVP